MDTIAQYKTRLLAALEQSLGVVTDACNEVGISRSTFYNYCREDEDFKKEVEELQDLALDFVESQLFKNIKNGSDACTIFYMKTKGKKRGYIERTELTGENGQPLYPSAVTVNLPTGMDVSFPSNTDGEE